MNFAMLRTTPDVAECTTRRRKKNHYHSGIALLKLYPHFRTFALEFAGGVEGRRGWMSVELYYVGYLEYQSTYTGFETVQLLGRVFPG